MSGQIGFSSHDGKPTGKESFYNVMRITGGGETPFYESLNHTVAFNGTSASLGHSWAYRKKAETGSLNNAHKEGACGIPAKIWPATKLHNELQIFRVKTAMTGSEIATARKQGGQCGVQNSFEEQQIINRNSLRLDMEVTMLSDQQPVASNTDDEIRKMGGAKTYIPANGVIDVADAALKPIEHVNMALRLMKKNGISNENIIIMAGGDVFEDINKYYQKNTIYNKNNPAHISQFVSTITTAYAKNVGVMGNDNLADNEMLIYAPRLINPVLLRSEKGKEATTPGCDFEAEEDLFELTLQVMDPYAIVHLKNVGRAAA